MHRIPAERDKQTNKRINKQANRQQATALAGLKTMTGGQLRTFPWHPKTLAGKVGSSTLQWKSRSWTGCTYKTSTSSIISVGLPRQGMTGKMGIMAHVDPHNQHIQLYPTHSTFLHKIHTRTSNAPQNDTYRTSLGLDNTAFSSKPGWYFCAPRCITASAKYRSKFFFASV